MKSFINKFFIGASAVLAFGLSSCVGDLDQVPDDPHVIAPDQFASNPREYLGGVMAKCYSGIAVSGQGGAGSSDISGLDNGTSCWSRAIFMLEEFTTDEVNWIWPDAGVFDLCTGTWSASNANIFGTYSRLYTHIAICNNFLRLANNPGEYDIVIDESLQPEIDQFKLEARALRDLSYYYVIDLFGNAVRAWDDMPYGEVPQQTTRQALFEEVTADLEEVVAEWPTSLNKQNVVYGRIGRDAVMALLCKFYLNAEVYVGKPMYDKVLYYANQIIANHQGGGFQNSGLANDYLAIFCGNNDMFMPGGSLSAAQNEILWGIPYSTDLTESYGGSMFLIASAITDEGKEADPSKGFMNHTWYGINAQWGCMHARQQFSNLFDFNGPTSNDGRVEIWGTSAYGFNIENTEFSNFLDGYAAIKFTNCMADATGNLPRWEADNGLIRVGEQPVRSNANFPDTDLPIIRLAEVYLIAAEAEYKAGNPATAVNYINLLRERACNRMYNPATLPACTTGELSDDYILAERARELYWENVRRTDLIRFGKFAGQSSYSWTWLNNMPTHGSMPAYMNLFPIPQDVIATYGSTYKQNPGY